MSQRNALLTEFFAKQKTRIKTMMQRHENAVLIRKSLKMRRGIAVIDTTSHTCYTFPMRKVADIKTSTVNTPPHTAI